MATATDMRDMHQPNSYSRYSLGGLTPNVRGTSTATHSGKLTVVAGLFGPKTPDVTFAKASPPAGQLPQATGASGTVRYFRVSGPVVIAANGAYQFNSNIPVGTYQWQYRVEDAGGGRFLADPGTVTVTA